MTFDPNQHEKKPILERLRAAPARFQVSRSVLTSFAVLLAISLWIGSGALDGDENAVEPAQAIKTRSLEETPFRVIAREISASDTTAIVRLQGRTEADRIVTLASETSGTIISLPTPKGRRVQKGQLICEIDAGARAAMLAEAKAKRDAARINYEASQRLFEKGHISKSQRATSKANFDAAAAAVKMHQVELSRTRIKAPFDGILDQLPLKAGAFIAPGQPCGTLIDKDPLLVVAHVAESQITKIRNGAPASAILATGENVTGFVRYIAESPSLATRTFQIEVEVENKNFLLRDGVSADLEIESERVRASQIPRSALTLDDNGRLGVRVLEGEIVAFREVAILSDQSDYST
ncbi:MAG: efflux RND transporter periplasmic adaptor subunit, partial [Pseudomonadota bacterium]|nr:efflux RND transporter periplasmic adaptor subunit [Pseudomonadota bacterium]